MSMTNMDKMTIEELEQEIEMWFDGIEDTLSNRCYPEHSRTGVRAIQLDVRKHLAWIDRALLEIEVRSIQAVSVKETEQVLEHNER